ncbi:MAG: hypothetical protein HY303_20990 [Candidatus Wallbacteria bacterium]|nr:hypothetical protein [Candidatus Wallbacteria bacterium]
MLACALVMLFALSCARPGQAFLTELVVGGELAYSAVTLIGQALPQIALVATNLLALVKTGQAIGDTLKKIGKTLFGGGKGPAPSLGSAQPSPVTSDVPQIPAIPMDSDAKKSEVATAAAAVEAAPSEIGMAIENVVDSYRQKLDLYNKLSGLPDGSPGRQQLAEPYSSLVNANEQAVSLAVTVVLDAVRDGNASLVNEFCESVKSLDGASRPAMIPVVNRVLEKGRTFATLQGEGDGLFPKIEALHTDLVN